ncbi:MAG: hypothetical protein HC923_09000, partial [Myxococcales bacterium]|nr:hypothetical protein [Myxococcales bacterium]
MKLHRVLALALLSSCIRDPADIPAEAEGGFVTGTVVERSLTTGELAPVEGARVGVRGRSVSTQTDSDGRFTLERLGLGGITLAVERRERTGEIGAARFLQLRVDGQSTDVGEIRISKDTTLKGLVFKEAPSGESIPAEGALVVIPGTPFQAVATRSGFTMPNLPPGTYDVSAFLPGHEPARTFGIEASPGQTVTLSALRLRAAEDGVTVTVNGSARTFEGDSEGITMEWAEQAAPEDPLAPITVDDPSGRYTVDLAPGFYRVVFAREDFIPVAFPNVAVTGVDRFSLWAVVLDRRSPNDADNDGVSDRVDPDDDNDGCIDEEDEFPLDPLACVDSDGDGIADEADADDDDDGLSDAEELSPGQDGYVTAALRPDTDDDGLLDAVDPCPTVVGTSCPASGELGLTDFQPNPVNQGATVTIFGRGFDPSRPMLVGFAGRYVEGAVLSSTRTLAQVPLEAASGPITLVNGDREVTSTEPLSILPRLRIVRIQPEVLTPNTLAAAYLINAFDAVLELSFDDGPATSPAACTPDQIDSAASGERALCFFAPEGAKILRVTSRDQSAVSPITVRPGPTIERFVPNPAAANVEVTLFGQNLSSDPPPTLRFRGSASFIAPFEVTDRFIRAIVPSDAVTGPVELEHPLGSITSPQSLIVDSTAPIVSSMDPILVAAGDEDVAIFGANLAATTAVTLPGGVPAENLRVTATRIDFDVPQAELQPGEVTVLVANRGIPVPVRMQTLTQTAIVTFGSATFTLAHGSAGPGLLRGVGRPGNIARVATLNLETGAEELRDFISFDLDNASSSGTVSGTPFVWQWVSTERRLRFVDVDRDLIYGECLFEQTGSISFDRDLIQLTREGMQSGLHSASTSLATLRPPSVASTCRLGPAMNDPSSERRGCVRSTPDFPNVLATISGGGLSAINAAPNDGIADGTVVFGPISGPVVTHRLFVSPDRRYVLGVGRRPALAVGAGSLGLHGERGRIPKRRPRPGSLRY